MRTIDANEIDQVSGGTFGLLFALFGRCNPAPVKCEPKAPAHPPRKRGC